MIITRTWLNNYLDITDISDEKLCNRLNSIGLEVDNIKTYTIPKGVVVGKIVSCQKHPDADKLSVCNIDIGGSVEQIVCGASNVVDATFVAVATIGTKLGDDFEIKPAKLRGVESRGMVCSSTELGLPKLEDGIMILDESIGELIVGKELNEYPKLADTVIELELTANRGDCLSIYGVARDLSAGFGIPLNSLEYESSDIVRIGLARVAELKAIGSICGSLKYSLANVGGVYTSLMTSFRLALIEQLSDNHILNLTRYVTHSTGVVIRAYDVSHLIQDSFDRITITVSTEGGITEIKVNGERFSILGVHQEQRSIANNSSTKILFEASYIDPNRLIEAVASKDLESDELFYNTSRGSEPNLSIGIKYITYLLETYSGSDFFDGYLSIEEEGDPQIITVSDREISEIIGKRIEKGAILNILTALGFRIHSSIDKAFGVTVPKFRHDIENIQDIAEEILRIVGIDNIDSTPLKFEEKNRINEISQLYYTKRSLRERSIASGFYESVSYAFTDKSLLQKYNFPLVRGDLDIVNPITEDLNTLRTTILINLLNAVKRNISYSKKRVALFEIGTVFNVDRGERGVLAIVFSGQREKESVINAGKPKSIDFETFIQKLSSIIGDFELRAGIEENRLMHPYQSADIIIDHEVCGFISKLHPVVAQDFDLPDTFVAEISLDALLPKHINASNISKFQGVYKDLSLVVDKNLPYNQVATAIAHLKLPLLKNYYPIDVYEDETLKNQKSLTIRLFIQSMEGTLEEKDIEGSVDMIIQTLKEQYGATLR